MNSDPNVPGIRSRLWRACGYLTIEETYELSDSILEKDMDGIKKELGDLSAAPGLLFQDRL